MISISDNNKHLINPEIRFNESIRKLIPNAKFICIKFYDDSEVKKNLVNTKNLDNCDIIEIVTHIPINTKKLRDLIKITGYRLFDVTYEPDRFHFFVRNVRGEEV